MGLTEKQIKLCEMYARKAGLKARMIIDWVESGSTTMAELASWVLWESVELWELE